jgi:hypothetical protein
MPSTTKEMEVLKLTPKESERKIASLEHKVANLTRKNKEQSASKIRQDKRERELRQSRDSWKAKLRDKSLEIKDLKKKLIRVNKPARHHYGIDLIKLSFLFRQQGKCSYSGISRILEILGSCGVLELARTPCANTVQNWVSKMGLKELETGYNSLKTNSVSLIVDESIKIGEEKLLVVLCCDSDKSLLGEIEPDGVKESDNKREIGKDLGINRAHSLEIGDKTGLSFTDIRICHVESRKSWPGVDVSYVLENVIKKLSISGQTVEYIQTDGDSKLKNAVDLLEAAVPQSLDISHGIGTCLKSTFEKEESFISFTKLISSYQSKGVTQALTFLTPPKQRTRVRFMNLKPVVVWAVKMLDRKDKLNEKEGVFFKDLPEHTPMIKLLQETMYLEEKVTTVLKVNGLTQELLFQIIQELTLFKTFNFGIYDNLRDNFAKYFEVFLGKYQTLIDKTKARNLGSLNVSTDIIESLFAKYKKIMPSNQYNSAASTAIELPIYSIESTISEQQIRQTLEKYFTVDLIEWKNGYSIESQAIKRRKFFKN